MISALIKSLRGSDPDAGVYWLARLLAAGEDPRFIARRLVILASARTSAWPTRWRSLVADAAAARARPRRAPRGRAQPRPGRRAPRPRAEVERDRQGASGRRRPTSSTCRPARCRRELRDAHYRGAAALGHGVGYEYPHDDPRGWVERDLPARRARRAPVLRAVGARPRGASSPERLEAAAGTATAGTDRPRTIDEPGERGEDAGTEPMSAVSSTPTGCAPPSPRFFVERGHVARAVGRADPAPPARAAVHQRRDEPVHPVLPGRGARRRSRGRRASRSACGSGASTTTSTSSGGPPATSRSSRCSATSASATTSRSEAIPFAWEFAHRCARPRRRPAVGDVFTRRRRGRRDLARRGRRSRRAHPADGRGQLLGDGRDRPVRSVLGDLLRPRRRATGPDGRPGRRRRRGALRRDLEPGLHAVRPPGRRQPRAAPEAEHRHRRRASSGS